MYINMTPDKTNKTLHASQDDTTRQFKFKLVNDSQVLDTSDSIPPVIYEVEPNGIEQLLPVNSSTPTTSPIIADIQYPDELREDQEFFERVTPTTLKGQAKIKKIKGNTLVWNQIAENGNFESATGWGGNNSSIAVANNVLTGTVTTSHATAGLKKLGGISFIANHKYLVSAVMSCSVASDYCVARFYATGYDFRTDALTIPANTKKRQIWTLTPTASFTGDIYIYLKYSFQQPLAVGDTFTFEKVMFIDLTQLFGAGNEPTTVEEFTNLFPLPYYDYNAGSLLSFNGTGIKTIGKNLYQFNDISGTQISGYYTTIETDFQIKPNTDYVFSADINTSVDLYTFSIGCGTTIYRYDINRKTGLHNGRQFVTFNLSEDVALNYGTRLFVRCPRYAAATTYTYSIKNMQLEFGTTPTDFEPYKESAIDLPISTYFPTGMKSAGTAYDELTKSKATIKIGVVDLGNLDYVYDSTVPRFYTSGLANIIKKPSTSDIKGNAISDMYEVLTVNQFFAQTKDKTTMVATNGNISFINTAYSSASAFKSAMNGVYLYYELVTKTEEDIESCSLVSEDIEIPLEYDDGFLVCDSEGLTSKAGFIPCKIKKVKGDQTIYSQLINLHVERKP